MSLTDWKPTKGILESDKDYQIRSNEWTNREINRSRWVSSETGGSGSRTSSNSGSGNDVFGCLLLMAGVAMLICIVAFIIESWVQCLIMTPVTALAVYLTSFWYILGRVVNNKTKVTNDFSESSGITSIFARWKEQDPCDFRSELRRKLLEQIGKIFSLNNWATKILAYTLFGIIVVLVAIMDWLMGSMVRIYAIGLFFTIPLAVYVWLWVLVFKLTT